MSPRRPTFGDGIGVLLPHGEFGGEVVLLLVDFQQLGIAVEELQGTHVLRIRALRSGRGAASGLRQGEQLLEELGGGFRFLAMVCAAIEVWSRLWTSTVVGRRSSRNTLALVRDVAPRRKFAAGPLIVTDGFEFYGTVIRRVVGPAALDAQVIKTRRHDRVVRVERRAVIGAAWRLDQALTPSEDSSTVNTSFIERLNLTIRQRSAYLSRRTLSHARSTDTLEAHLALLRCYYNFVRPHGALKFGRETRTPAMQAGLATRRLTLRDIFVSLRSLVASLSDVLTLAHSRRMAAAAIMLHAGCGVTTLDDGSTVP